MRSNFEWRSGSSKPTARADKAAAREVAYLQTRDAILAQRAAVEQQIKDLNSRKERIEAQLKSPPAPDKAPTFADLDRMKDDLATSQAKAALLADKLETATSNKDRAQAALDESQVKCRQAQAAYESGKSGPKATELSAAADRARHDVELATETLTLRKSELDRGQLAKEVQQLSVKQLQDKVERTRPLVTLSEADYQQQIDDIKKIQDATKSSLSRAESDMRSTEVEIGRTQKAARDCCRRRPRAAYRKTGRAVAHTSTGKRRARIAFSADAAIEPTSTGLDLAI